MNNKILITAIVLVFLILTIPAFAAKGGIPANTNGKGRPDFAGGGGPKPLGPCPLDDTYITSSMTLGPDYCPVEDVDNNGILIVTGDNLVLDCNGLTLVGTNSGTGIYITGENVIVKGCIVQDYGIGIYTNGNNVTVRDSLVQDNGDGIFSDDASLYQTKLINNTAISNTGSGLRGEGQNTSFENNTVYGNSNGLTITGRGNTLTGNIMNNNNYNLDIAINGLSPLYTYLKETTIDTTNLVDNKPVYHLVGTSSLVLDSSSNAGFISCLDCTNVVIKDLDFRKNSHGAILLHGNSLEFKNNTVTTNKNGIIVTESTNIDILNNTITNHWSGPLYSAIYMYKVSPTNIEGNSISQGMNAIKITSSGNSGLIKNNNIFSNNGDAVNAKGEFRVESNIITDNGNGILAEGASFVINNIVLDNYNGIQASGTNSLVANNYVYGNSEDGVLIGGPNMTFYNNTMLNSGEIGLRISAYDGSRIFNNTIISSGVGHDAVVVSGSNNEIFNNTIENSGKRGIFVNMANGNIISYNTITNSKGEDGIRLTLSDYTEILNNIIINSSDNSLYFDSASHTTITFNKLEGNGQNGIFIYGSSVDNTFTNNSICRSSQYGISMSFYPNTNYFYLNNFIDSVNSPQVENSGTNYYNSTGIGNYWSDYNGSDGNGDGIGDTPYVIDIDNQDSFPLIQKNPNAPPCLISPGAPHIQKVVLTGFNHEDVEINWTAASGEVENYTLSFECYNDLGGIGAAFDVPSTGADSYSHIFLGQGDDNLDTCLYNVTANNAVGSTPSDTQGGKFARNLTIGSHDYLLSIPLIQWNTSMPDVLIPLNFTDVQHYNASDKADPWKHWRYDKPDHMNDLRYLDHTMAFFPSIRDSDNFTTAGIVPVSTTVHLETKWNMIAYPSFTERTVADALSGITYDTVEEYDPNYHAMLPSDIMKPGHGYWIHVPFEQDWTLDW